MLGIDAEAAGLALFVCKGSLNVLQARLNSEDPNKVEVPAPGDVVSMTNMRKVRSA